MELSTQSFGLPKLLGRQATPADGSIFDQKSSCTIIKCNAQLSNFDKLHGGTGAGQGEADRSEDQALLQKGMFRDTLDKWGNISSWRGWLSEFIGPSEMTDAVRDEVYIDY